MVRVYQQTQQLDPRQEWLQALEQQAREKREQRERDKQERLGAATETREVMPYFGSDSMPQSHALPLGAASFNNNEFGGRRRPYQDIVKFEKDYIGTLPSAAPVLSKTEEYFQKRLIAERKALLEEQTHLPQIQSHHQVQLDSHFSKNAPKEVGKRVPFSGAVMTKSPSHNKMKSFLDAKEPSEMDKKEREAQAWKEYLKMQIQEKKDRLAREKQFEQEQDARAAARFARELEMEERAARGESKEKELEAFTPKPEINIETKLPSMTKNQKVPKAPQTTVSKLPVLRGLPRHLDPIDSNRLQPLIERIKELSEAVIIHPSPPPQSLTRSSTTKMLNGRHCPQPPSHQQPNGAPPSSNRSLRYGQKLAKKITQKFPIRGDLNTPPKNGIRVWPAGSKAYSQYPPDPLPHIPHHSLRNVPEEEKEEATKTTTDPRVKRFVRQDPVTHRSQVPQPPPKPVKGLTPIPPPMQEDEEEMYDDSKEEESPSSEKPMATKPTTTGQCPPSPLIHGRNKAGASVGSSAESIERREAVEKLEAVWKDFVKSKTEEYGIAPSG